jgi:hypothetical protein
MHNPSGDIDIARIEDVQVWQPKIAEELLKKRGSPITDEHFAYFIGKRGVWVRRIAIDVFRDCGISAFKPPHEASKGSVLSKRVYGKKQNQ